MNTTPLLLTAKEWSGQTKEDKNTKNQGLIMPTCPLSIVFRRVIPLMLQETMEPAMGPMMEQMSSTLQQSQNDMLNPSSSMQQLALHGLPGSAHSSFSATSQTVFREKQSDGNFKLTTQNVQIQNNDRTTKNTNQIVSANGTVLESSEVITNDKVNPAITSGITYPVITNSNRLQLAAGSLKKRGRR